VQVGELFFRARWMDLIGTEIIVQQDGNGIVFKEAG
jgi:hypothetical protein